MQNDFLPIVQVRHFFYRISFKAKILNILGGAKNQKLVWTEECDKAFREMKEGC